jgi:hypothetical protein
VYIVSKMVCRNSKPPGLDVADRMDGLALFIAVPTIMSIWETAVVDKADGRVDSANHRTGAARQSICLDDTAEWVLARKVVVEGQKLSLLSL